MKIKKVIDEYKSLEKLQILNTKNGISAVRKAISIVDSGKNKDIYGGIKSLVSELNYSGKYPIDKLTFDAIVYGKAVVRSGKVVGFDINRDDKFLLRVFDEKRGKMLNSNEFYYEGKLEI